MTTRKEIVHQEITYRQERSVLSTTTIMVQVCLNRYVGSKMQMPISDGRLSTGGLNWAERKASIMHNAWSEE
jgi:hypothetical protein